MKKNEKGVCPSFFFTFARIDCHVAGGGMDGKSGSKRSGNTGLTGHLLIENAFDSAFEREGETGSRSQAAKKFNQAVKKNT